jgi:hypothetical protein
LEQRLYISTTECLLRTKLGISASIIATGVGNPWNNVTFGDMNRRGKKDPVFVHADSGELDV